MFVGYSSGFNNIAAENTFIGSASGFANTSGSNNSFLGRSSGRYNTEGSHNTFSGFSSGFRNAIGNYNTFSGSYAGYENTEGSSNTAVGYRAGFGNVTGNNNIFLGRSSGYFNTIGNYNTFSGSYAGYHNTEGESNTAIGYRAGFENETGIQNTFLGRSSGYNSKGRGNVFIGYNTGFNELGDNKLIIDNSSTDTPLIYGDFSANKVVFNGDIGISTTDTFDYKLAVAGTTGIIAEKVTVKLKGQWPDYVFNKEYELPTLKEVEKHINKKGHLQNIPSTKDMKESDGIDLGGMNIKLLEKIEELTLYTIQQEKEILELKKKFERIEAFLESKK